MLHHKNPNLRPIGWGSDFFVFVDLFMQYNRLWPGPGVQKNPFVCPEGPVRALPVQKPGGKGGSRPVDKCFKGIGFAVRNETFR